MKRRYILTLLLACVYSIAHAYDFVVDGIAYTIISMSGFECEVVANDTPYVGKVVIPSVVQYRNKELTVKSVGAGSFKNATSLSEVVLPATVETLGNSCFYGCTSLESVNLPNDITSIGEMCFYGCTRLKDVEFSNLSAENTSIGASTFSDCSSLVSIQLPKSVKEVGVSAFAGCKSLEAIDLSMLTEIPKCICEGCESLIDVTFSESLTEIGTKAFKGCADLTDVRIGNLPLREIGRYAFSGCGKITSIVFGDSLKTIDDYAFENTGFRDFIVPNSVTSLGKCVVSGPNLKSFTLGNGVTVLSYNPLPEDAHLNTLTFVDGDADLNLRIVYDISREASTFYENVWEDNAGTKYYTTCRIGRGMFSNIKIDSLYIGRHFVNLSTSSAERNRTRVFFSYPPFSHNTSLKSVTFSSYGNSTTKYSLCGYTYSRSLCQIPFMGCTALEKIAFLGNSIDVGVYDIKQNRQYPFKGCTSLRTVIIDGTFTDVPIDIFRGCTSLRDVYLGSSIKTINPEAFSECDSLSNIYCMAATPPKYDTGFSKDVYLNCNLYVPQASLEAFQQTSPWNIFWNITAGVNEVVNDACDEIKLTVADGKITVIGKQSNDHVQVYTIQGKLVAQTNSDTVAIMEPGTYIIRIGNFIQKVVVNLNRS